MRTGDHQILDSRMLSELLTRIGRQKDASAFLRLYAATRPKMVKTAAAVLASGNDVDDILQEGYVKIWRRADTFDASKASAIAWMSTIIRNTAIDYRRMRRPSVNLDEVPEIAAEHDDPLQLIQDSATERVVMRAVARLPPDRRYLVTQAYIHGTSRAELARQYDVPENTIKTWLRRALAKVRENLPAEIGVVKAPAAA